MLTLVLSGNLYRSVIYLLLLWYTKEKVELYLLPHTNRATTNLLYNILSNILIILIMLDIL